VSSVRESLHAWWNERAMLYWLTLALPVSVGGCAVMGTAPSSAAFDPRGVVSAPGRQAEDLTMDTTRRPAEMIAFFGVRPGDRVAELAAGGGYTAELLARAVGPAGRVYGVNTAFILQRFAEKQWSARLAKPEMRNVVRVDRELEDPFPAEVRDLDLVVMVLFYHDTYWFMTDRGKMNQAIFRALRPGGAFVVIDHSAQEGAGASVAKTYHRIDERLVRQEVAAAGFTLAEESSFLRNPEDTRDWNVFDKTRRGTTDRFALKFTKPKR
jgi:predicted methyltransferase